MLKKKRIKLKVSLFFFIPCYFLSLRAQRRLKNNDVIQPRDLFQGFQNKTDFFFSAFNQQIKFVFGTLTAIKITREARQTLIELNN